MSFRFQSSSSARRRRLRLLAHDSLQAEALEPQRIDSSGVAAAVIVSATLQPEVESGGLSIDRSFSAEELELPRTIPHLVSSPVPVSWLFVGDSFTPKNVTEPRPWRVYTNRFAGAVRTHFKREKDVFIDATFPSARLSEVLFDFERRIAKFEPDICFLSLSLAEAEAKSVDRFVKMLVRLIRWSKKFDCQLVLQTPPCLPSKSDAELTRRLILVESIRGIAAEHSTPLIDHWEHWEWAASQVSHKDSWVDAETQTPAEQGHRQLARRLIQDLKLSDVAQSDFSVSMKESIVVDEQV